MNTKLYPLKFIPVPKEKVWGGHDLIKVLKKDFSGEIDPREDIEEQKKALARKKIGESWEICSLNGESSRIAEGFLADNTLDDFIETYMGDAVGDANFIYYRGEFPLLIKTLDIKDRLSVQTHPDDKTAMERHGCFGKAECWYILDAKPEAKIYMGFNKDMTPQELYDRCKNGTVEEVLNVYTPKPGDFIYIEPGCVHAAGGGVMIAEIQQSCDVSYRLYDWGREHDPKTARRMDLEEAIDIIDYKKYEKDKYYFSQVTGSKLIVNTSRFIIKTLDLTEQTRIFPGMAESFIIYLCIRGEAHVQTNDHQVYSLKKGESMLIPAGMEDFLMVPDKGNPYLLEICLPQPEEEPDNYLNYEEEDHHEHCGCGHCEGEHHHSR